MAYLDYLQIPEKKLMSGFIGGKKPHIVGVDLGTGPDHAGISEATLRYRKIAAPYLFSMAYNFNTNEVYLALRLPSGADSACRTFSKLDISNYPGDLVEENIKDMVAELERKGETK